ncbi:uncharacterized protein LOC128743741 [Sabethes cyaneus]|uniref:uncharacterized protein LOC128743741 n=1 Tax=Sabethes cyaneus TaxID=53552 RepID=UPI00221E316D|nr:uncharacterized protein LOC128743741 [Sabethes cyaneus]
MEITSRVIFLVLVAIISITKIECIPFQRTADDGELVQRHSRDELLQLFQEDVKLFSSSHSNDISSEEVFKNVLLEMGKSTTISPVQIQQIRNLIEKYTAGTYQ